MRREETGMRIVLENLYSFPKRVVMGEGDENCDRVG